MRALITKVWVRLAYLRAERGATAVEYALLIAFIAAAIIAGASTLGAPLSDAFQSVIDGLP